jgi:enoyl-CoA hydratase
VLTTHRGFECTLEEGCWIVRLCRPERRNALDEQLATDLAGCLRDLSSRAPGTPLVLCSDGPAFSAGADVTHLKGVVDRAERERRFADRARTLTPALVELIDALASSDQVTLASIQGAAAGGGWSLALACDLRFAAPEATFWFPEVEYGRPLSEKSIAMLLPKVGQARTAEIVLTARRYSAADLLAFGLVNEVMPAATLMTGVMARSRRLAAMAPSSLCESKRRIRRQADILSLTKVASD